MPFLNLKWSEYAHLSLRPHFIECLKSEQMTPFPSKNIQPGKPKTEYTVTAACHMMVSNGWLSALVAKNGTTKSCENIPQVVCKVYKDDSNGWKCKVCIAREKQSA